MYLIFHLTSHEHLIKGSCEFMGRDSLQYDTTLISFVTITIVIVEI